MQRASSSTRQTLPERRRRLLRSELGYSRTRTPTTPTPVEAPTAAARYEQILIKFYFQRVLPDESRTAHETTTAAVAQSGEQVAMPPESPVLPDTNTAALETLQADEQEGAPSQTFSIQDEENQAGSQDNKNQVEFQISPGVLSQRLPSWRKASSLDECYQDGRADTANGI
eukprot:scaffold9527_cov101-Cylindrotheca_fusiformis.AAC.1